MCQAAQLVNAQQADYKTLTGLYLLGLIVEIAPGDIKRTNSLIANWVL